MINFVCALPLGSSTNMDSIVVIIYYGALAYAANLVFSNLVEKFQDWVADRSEKHILKYYLPHQRLIYPIIPEQLHAKSIWKNRVRASVAIDDGITPQGTKYPTILLSEIILDRYQIVAKLGVGDISSVWLMRDLMFNTYVAAKLYAHLESAEAELEAFDRIESVTSPHRGQEFVRQRITTMNICREEGDWHETILQAVVCNNLSDEFLALKYGPERMPIQVIKSVVYQVLLALDFLHTQCRLVHTGVHGGNVFLNMPEAPKDSVLDEFVLAELHDVQMKGPDDKDPNHPPRLLGLEYDVNGVRLGGFSRSVPVDEEPLGDAAQASELSTCVYQAPELMFATKFSYGVDIWSLGCWMWELVYGQPLFDNTVSYQDAQTGIQYQIEGYKAVALNIANALGPPPDEMREGIANSAHFGTWAFADEDGFTGPCRFDNFQEPPESKNRLEYVDREMLLSLMENMVQWRPEDRRTAGELLRHPWFADLGLYVGSQRESVVDSANVPSGHIELEQTRPRPWCPVHSVHETSLIPKCPIHCVNPEVAVEHEIIAEYEVDVEQEIATEQEIVAQLEVTVEENVTVEQDVTVEEEVAIDEEVTAEPEVPVEPELIVEQPEVTEVTAEGPGVIAKPDVAVEEEVAAEPEVSSRFKATVEEQIPVEPEVTAKSH
ncbi:unnamed protein product [Penicillium salamii]|nr:unnamed protein product [Penicillium salamii]CAG8151639.1 unnamed protein product [Penicillium salamii]CAG8402440.1 unnamed protein product [Penicillium salamii]